MKVNTSRPASASAAKKKNKASAPKEAPRGFKKYLSLVWKQLPKKLLSLLVQILMVPVSVLISGLGSFMVYYVSILGICFYEEAGDSFVFGMLVTILYSLIFQVLFYFPGLFILCEVFKVKNIDVLPETIEGSYYTYEAEVEHDIMDRHGVKIGSYTTTETKEGYHLSSEEKVAILKNVLLCTIALPCRLISVVAAFVSLFCPCFFVMRRRPKLPGKRYSNFLHKYFDIVIPI